MYKLTTRKQWGARPPSSPLAHLDLSQIYGEAWHYTGGPPGERFHINCARQVRGIQNYHMDSRGFRDIAYNFLVCRHGGIFEGRSYGFHSAGQGCESGDPGMAKNGNDHYHAVCFLGDDNTLLTDAAKRAFLALHEDLYQRFHVQANGYHILGHKDICNTSCPGEHVYQWIKAGEAKP